MPMDEYTGKRITWACARKLVYPYPVVQAHMSDGRVIRMAFWAPAKADDTELIERARRFACLIIRHRGEPYPGFVGDWPEVAWTREDRIIRLYVEDGRRPGEAFSIDPCEETDPWGPEAYPVKNGRRKAAVTKADWQKTMRGVLKVLDGSADAAAARVTVARARELLAA